MRIRIERLLFPPNVPAGMNPYVLMSLAYQFRATNEDFEPILVTREGDYWRIRDGRHRVTASILAGRSDILAVEQDSADKIGE